MKQFLNAEILAELRQGTPETIHEAIARGLKSGDVRDAVRDFLSQKFGAEMVTLGMLAKEDPAKKKELLEVKRAWIAMFPEEAKRFPEAVEGDEHEVHVGIGA